jgi:hypothetical protein
VCVCVCVCVCACVCVCVCVCVCAVLPGFFFFKMYLFYACEYTVAIFRHTRRGHRIPLQIVVSHHVVAEPSLQPYISLLTI